MNISTGGPHILLFERDQQLAALLMSELQLAGYEGHTARTAVEVFDAIARYPVRLVLVNLAQAAAARREFWVALDTQRRGGSIQVLTFHCTNLAGYGPRDFEEHLTVVADLEVDGMLGLMKLIDVVRARVPNVDVNAPTMPRMNRTTSSTPKTTARFNESVPVSNMMSNNSIINNGANSHNTMSDDRNSQLSSTRLSAASMSHTPPVVAPLSSVEPPSTPQVHQTSQIPLPTPQVHQTSQIPLSPPGGRNSQAAYPEKIRAVIYPSQQRNWNTLTPAGQDAGLSRDSVAYAPSPAHAASDTPVLHGLAHGQLNVGSPGESGLAQLTRMVQESHPAQGPLRQAVPSPEDTYVLPTYTVPTARAGNAGESISSQSLRPAPIQGLSGERPVTASPSGADAQRRPEVLSRTNNYNQPSSVQVPPSALQSPLASIATSGTSASAPSTSAKRETADGANRPVTSKDLQKSKEDLTTLLQTALQAKIESERAEKEAQAALERAGSDPSEHERGAYEDRAPDEIPNSDGEGLAENAVILDILQSLPPIPTVGQQQAIQAQVLNGRATRSLGSVLLDGHLVPQERLEVAQNIQRMLRGVDLNYQLGEILLMFKLLTPDQLLAASLVSYGLITTTQVSAFGRIRQELHSIGLEYDLENLLVLFRILTPEQLREARSNTQN
jgi:hypothetical protein